MSFVVPDSFGLWEYGCFQQTGEHYLNGMKGVLEVVVAGSSASGLNLAANLYAQVTGRDHYSARQ